MDLFLQYNFDFHAIFFKVAKCRDHAFKKIELLKFRGAEYKYKAKTV